MKQAVVNLLKDILKDKGIKLSDEELEKYIEIPPSSELGDYAFPCFFIAKELKQDPHQIALEIREKIGEPPLDFEDIQTSGGYVNFFLDRKDFARKILKEILNKKENFGKTNIGQGKKALIYQQVDEAGIIMGYEVFEMRIQMAREKIIKGKRIDFIMKLQFPTDRAFGVWAWSFRELKYAKERFEQLENKAK